MRPIMHGADAIDIARSYLAQFEALRPELFDTKRFDRALGAARAAREVLLTERETLGEMKDPDPVYIAHREAAVSMLLLDCDGADRALDRAIDEMSDKLRKSVRR